MTMARREAEKTRSRRNAADKPATIPCRGNGWQLHRSDGSTFAEYWKPYKCAISSRAHRYSTFATHILLHTARWLISCFPFRQMLSAVRASRGD